MRPPSSDTIFATASAVSRAAVTIVRLSGPRSREILACLCGGRSPAPRVASLRRLRAPSGEDIDRAMVLWFPKPRSYTGDDVVEFHLHGGRAVMEAVGGALATLGARPADPGEFTRRAFLNGKCDLLEAEAIADLVDAETQAQRRQALRQLDGALGRCFHDWAARLTSLLAHQEALIDFPDEDLPNQLETAWTAEMAALASEMLAPLSEGQGGERVRDGLVFAVTGAPNAGKSTLVNVLAGREVAIVAETPGTTRDVLEARIVMGDVPVTLLDTAGLRDTSDPIEAEGVRRARLRARDADLRIQLVDATSPRRDIVAEAGPRVLIVASKVDLATPPDWAELAISAATGTGIPALRAKLDEVARELTAVTGSAPLTRARHRSALTLASAAVNRARRAVLPELRAEELRAAIGEIGRVTGHVGVEAILDAVFSQFCIGK